MDVLDKADSTCDQTLVETDKVIKVSDFLGKPNIKRYFYALSKISDEKKLKIVFSLIAQESLCVCDIAYILDCSIAKAIYRNMIMRSTLNIRICLYITLKADEYYRGRSVYGYLSLNSVQSPPHYS